MMISSAVIKRLPRTTILLQKHVTPATGSIAPLVHNHRFFSSKNGNTFGRIPGITPNPNSIGAQILPGGTSVIKKDSKSGEDRMILVERAYGYFWMINDLTKNGNKPILSNTTLIPEEDAQPLSTLMDFTVLDSNDSVDIPSYFIQNNRARNPAAQCTLVTIAYKEYGYKLLPSWTDPFEAAFGLHNERTKAMRVSITEGRFTKMLLSGIMKRNFRKNTPPQVQSQTLLSFGPNEAELKAFNDSLRIHNTLTNYVFLLDGVGRVRFAGSGEATEEEAQRVIEFAKELVPRWDPNQPPPKKFVNPSRRREQEIKTTN